MLVIIDNYDSFTYNLVQYLGELGADLQVYRNDKFALEDVDQLKPDKLVISPGPCTPNEAGLSLPLIQHIAGKIPLLGVCLGHQCIGQAFGGRIVQAPYLMHGKTSQIHHDGKTIYEGLENPFIATRYHSLIVDRAALPGCFEISAWTEDDVIMGLRHREYDIEGVQFHPESILTEVGKSLLKNFLEY